MPPIVLPGEDNRLRKHFRSALSGAACLAFSYGLAHAQVSGVTVSTPEIPELPSDLAPSIASSYPALGEFKKGLFDLGYKLQVNFTGEIFGNPAGGVRKSVVYDNLLELALDGDLNKIAGLNGASFHINGFIIGGIGPSTCCILNVLTVSNIEALPSTRLFEAWIEQKFLDGLISIRAGQLAANTDYTLSEYSAMFINASFGWANIFAADLPSGGPNYPLATPGIRFKIAPADAFDVHATLFNGDPSGAGFTGSPEVLDPAGVNFRLRDAPLFWAEAEYKYHQGKASSGLPGTVKLGGWYHFGKFNDQYFSSDGLLLFSPSSSSVPLTHRGDFGIYAMIDQLVWRVPGDDPAKGAAVFALLSASPADRNLESFYAEGGFNCTGIWTQRPDDAFGLGVIYAPVSPQARAFDAVAGLFYGAAAPPRSYEMALEAVYQARLGPGWYVQPDFQFIIYPLYGAANPLNPALSRMANAAAFGIRMGISF